MKATIRGVQMRHLSLILALATAACRSTAAPAPGATITDSSGVALVVNRTPLWDSGHRWTVDSVPITSIGGDESDPHQHFRYVTAARRLSDGRVLVVAENELRWFAPDGKYLKTTIHAGDGPGEFRDLSHLLRQAGDTLLAADWIGRKIGKFAPDGSLVREDLLDFERYRKLGRWGECWSDILPDGSRLGCQHDASIPATKTNRPSVDGDPGPGLLRSLNRIYVVPPSLDTAYAIGIDAGIEQFGINLNGTGTSFFVHPFYARSFIAAGGTPMRIAEATNPGYEIQIWTPTGKLERVIRRIGARRAPTAAEKVEAEAAMRKSLAQRPDHPDPDRIIAAVPAPDSLPAVVGLVVGPGGEILVQREGLRPPQPASLFDVFEATGRWLGEIRLPARTRLVEMGSDYLLGVRSDNDDVPRVEVYRLRR